MLQPHNNAVTTAFCYQNLIHLADVDAETSMITQVVREIRTAC